MAPALVTRPGKILYLDAYDSFSNNIIALAEEYLDAKVVSIRIDDPRFHTCTSDFVGFLKNFDAVIAGPGPGTAGNDEDVGLMKKLWTLEEGDMVPVLGICLGFQSMVTAFGADIERLVEPRHGLISEILHKERSILKGVDELCTTQYHSLQANIGHTIQTKRSVKYPEELWQPSEKCPDLEPLAWDFDSKPNGAVLMAARHTSKPFWGVQFHPESICSNSQNIKLMQNWWLDAQAWIRERALKRAKEQTAVTSPISSLTMTSFSSLLNLQDMNDYEGISVPNSRRPSQIDMGNHDPATIATIMAYGDGNALPELPPHVVHCATAGSGRLRVSDVCEVLRIPENEAIVLESCLQPDLLPMKVGTGRYSIMGLIVPGETLRLHYSTTTRVLQLRDGNDKMYLETEVDDIWSYIKTIMHHLKPKVQPPGPSFAPFWGGLMGYVSYEAGLETIDVQPQPEASSQSSIPDICFAYITRSVVIDHKVKKIYVQSIRGGDDMPWVRSTLDQIWDAASLKSQASTPSPDPIRNPCDTHDDALVAAYLKNSTTDETNEASYSALVDECKESIAAGQSYELCLTSSSTVTIPSTVISPRTKEQDNRLSWSLYKRLLATNPAPFSAYLRLHNMHLLSSSPERFISWDRNGVSQCRPIKGTVKKSSSTTYADAHAILSSSKERAENLMIVDLTRHQLHGVYGSGNVHVRQLMEIEEYETLYQLVSVIEGVPKGVQKARTPEEWEEPPDYVSGKPSGSTANMGFDAFVQSLPPGSMTGAPKKRSCEILGNLEKRRRGVYAGCLGYLDVGGGGDFSVVIRTAIKVNGEAHNALGGENEEEIVDGPVATSKQDIWHISAGGAVTAQSTAEGEYAEMLAKFHSTAAAFRAPPDLLSVPKARHDSLPEGAEVTTSSLDSLLR